MEEEEGKRTLQSFQEYFAGASLAFGLVLLTFQAIGLYYSWSGQGGTYPPGDWFVTLYLGMHILSGLLGGFLVARRSRDRAIQVGGMTGVLAYIIEAIYFLIFGGRIVGDLWTLASIVGGGIAGGLYAEKRRRTTEACGGSSNPRVPS